MNRIVLPNIGPLRGFLALFVVIFHIPELSKSVDLPYFSDLPIFHKGEEAVWVFFTLSGFLIIKQLYLEQKKGKVEIKKFYARRILRIYPVYYVVLIFGFTFYHFLLPLFGIDYHLNYSLWEGIVWCVGFLPNVFNVLYAPGAILLVLWSIGIEEQFYLIIAPLARISTPKTFIIGLILFTIVSFILFFLPSFSFLRTYYFIYFYMSFGGLIAVLNVENKIPFLVFKNGIIRILLYTVFFLYFLTDVFNFSSNIILHLFSFPLFGLFILNISSEKRFIVNNKVLIYLGTISYGIYMYHMIALNFVLFIVMKTTIINSINKDWLILLINSTTILLTIGIAHLSFYYFEKPIINLKKYFK
ncbi:acyltransferase family protein [Flammeovirga kamogawensis]|uniref:Acyltransferase n=1 Tax=Flammeovirga kamogawensis TaxID=373891 RepID=A0ABX8H399_9BACT|nr:acyltransferase [Flammeovirga kamogawensis]MBB6460225.1 peptidoglycan/LPS O-acetylase OafA/YrhL [Flammeovirga kamogawensis]QWG10037.1 acyltransferase [Flammeovirga kamogawensis]TRX65544.1 acyltransferase [Flammeovirga kamogawensis]